MSQTSEPTQTPTTPTPGKAPRRWVDWVGYSLLGAIGLGLTITMLVPGGWASLISGARSNTRSGRTLAFLQSLGYGPSLAIFVLLAVGGVAGAVISYKKAHPKP